MCARYMINTAAVGYAGKNCLKWLSYRALLRGAGSSSHEPLASPGYLSCYLRRAAPTYPAVLKKFFGRNPMRPIECSRFWFLCKQD